MTEKSFSRIAQVMDEGVHTDKKAQSSVGGDLGIDEFTQGYIEAAFWTEDESEELEDLGFYDIAPEALKSVSEECDKFQSDNSNLLSEYYAEREGETEGTPEANAGHDFWLTRNGHGVGFWDRGLSEYLGDALTEAADAYGESYMYAGDDNKVYFD